MRTWHGPDVKEQDAWECYSLAWACQRWWQTRAVVLAFVLETICAVMAAHVARWATQDAVAMATPVVDIVLMALWEGGGFSAAATATGVVESGRRRRGWGRRTLPPPSRLPFAGKTRRAAARWAPSGGARRPRASSGFGASTFSYPPPYHLSHVYRRQRWCQQWVRVTSRCGVACFTRSPPPTHRSYRVRAPRARPDLSTAPPVC